MEHLHLQPSTQLSPQAGIVNLHHPTCFIKWWKPIPVTYTAKLVPSYNSSIPPLAVTMSANSGSNRDVPRVILEDTSNWEDWAMQTEILFERAGVLPYINGQVPADQFDKQKNLEALLLLISYLSPQLRKSLRDAGYSRSMPAWRVLQLLHHLVPPPSPPQAFERLKELVLIDRANFPTLRAFVDRFEYLWNEVAKKEKLSDGCWTSIALNGIKNVYPRWYQHWQNQLQRQGTIPRDHLYKFLVENAYIEAQQNASTTARMPPGNNNNNLGVNANGMFHAAAGVAGNGTSNQLAEPVTGECNCWISRAGVSHQIEGCLFRRIAANDPNFQQDPNTAS